MPRVLVFGSINNDLVVRGLRLPQRGETVLGGEFYRSPGGKGANQAVAAARVADDLVVFIGAVGDDDFGRAVLHSLGDENIDCSWIEVIGHVPTGVALILVDEHGENMISVASGANMEFSADHVRDLPDEAFEDVALLLVSAESPIDSIQRMLQRAKERGLRTVLNPAPADPRLAEPGLLELVDVLTPNEREAAQLAGIEIRDDETAIAAGRKLREKGAGACIITRGSAGCVIVTDQTQVVPAWQVQPVDTTAAGDAFNGVLAVALVEGQSLSDAAAFASRAAAISVTRRGAQNSLPTREEIEAFE